MTDTTPVYGIPYPESADPPDGPSQMQALALEVETELVRVDAAATALTATVAARAKGVVSAGSTTSSGDVGTTETIISSRTFTAEANRCYRVSYTTPVLDNQGTASQTAIVTLRHAAGASVTNAGTLIAKAINNVPPTTTSTSPGTAAETATLVGWINNAPAGQRTVGVGLAALSASSNIRTLAANTVGPDLNPLLVIEDVGPNF